MMLEEVVFVLKRDTLKKNKICEQLEDATGYIRESGYNAYAIFSGSFLEDFHDSKDKGRMLVIADDPEVAERLLDEGYYCVGLNLSDGDAPSFPNVKYIFSDISELDIDSYVKVYQRYSGEPWEILRTDRLLIRETTLEDVDEFYKIYADPRITRFMEGLFADPEDEKRYQRDYIIKVYGLMGFGVWTLERLSDGAVIGRAGYSIRNGFDDVELGFLVGTSYQGQGYAKEACRAILDYGRDILGFKKVQTLVKAENEVSIRLCESLGFERIDEVEVEENIYGNKYMEGQKVVHSECSHGKYIRMTLVY